MEHAIIVMTDEFNGTPHMEALTKSNPESAIFVYTNPKYNWGDAEFIYEQGWRNCDRNIPSAIVTHINQLAYLRNKGLKCITFLGWDVFCNVDISKTIQPKKGLQVNEIHHQLHDEWPWFREKDKLPKCMHPHIFGIVPMCVMTLSIDLVFDIIHHKFYNIFMADIFCELRFPTLCSYLGYPISEYKNLPGYIHWDAKEITNETLDGPGIYHPVKFKPATAT